jgi:F-box domain
MVGAYGRKSLGAGLEARLPQSTWEEILSFCSIETVLVASLVCKEFCQVLLIPPEPSCSRLAIWALRLAWCGEEERMEGRASTMVRPLEGEVGVGEDACGATEKVGLEGKWMEEGCEQIRWRNVARRGSGWRKDVSKYDGEMWRGGGVYG